MIRFVLDTDTLTLFDRKHAAVALAFAAHEKETAVTAITVEEQFGGWFGQLNRVKTPSQYASISAKIAATAELLRAFIVIPMSEAAVARFEDLVELKLNVGRMDLRIAAVALEANAAVVTRNRRDFGRVPGLTVVDWSV